MIMVGPIWNIRLFQNLFLFQQLFRVDRLSFLRVILLSGFRVSGCVMSCNVLKNIASAIQMLLTFVRQRCSYFVL